MSWSCHRLTRCVRVFPRNFFLIKKKKTLLLENVSKSDLRVGNWLNGPWTTGPQILISLVKWDHRFGLRLWVLDGPDGPRPISVLINLVVLDIRIKICPFWTNQTSINQSIISCRLVSVCMNQTWSYFYFEQS